MSDKDLLLTCKKGRIVLPFQLKNGKETLAKGQSIKINKEDLKAFQGIDSDSFKVERLNKKNEAESDLVEKEEEEEEIVGEDKELSEKDLEKVRDDVKELREEQAEKQKKDRLHEIRKKLSHAYEKLNEFKEEFSKQEVDKLIEREKNNQNRDAVIEDLKEARKILTFPPERLSN